MNLLDLWLPIVLSAAAVWVASALAWMVMPHHKSEFKKLPDEDAVARVVREQKLTPGMYAFPDCGDHSKMKDPEFIKKMNDGPVGMLHVWPPGMQMGGKMAASFVFYLVVSVFVAYLASRSLSPGASFGSVFQMAGVAAIMAYCFATIPNDIWFNKPLNARVSCFVDGIVYGLITGTLFAWLWPTISGPEISIPGL